MVFVEITTNIYRSLIFTAIRNLPSVCLKRLSKSFGSTVKIRQKTPIWALSQLGDSFLPIERARDQDLQLVFL
mgnify:CR=1 FL=1